MQTCKLEIVELAPDDRRLLYALATQLREVANFVWRQWEVWHTQRDTPTRLRALLEADRAWRALEKNQRGQRPKWDVQCWPNEFGKLLYHATARRFPGLNRRVLVLATQRIRQNCTTKQSTAVPMKWWIAILLDLDSRATARHAQPLPLDKANAKVLPADEQGRVWLEVRLDRIARDGLKTATSQAIRVALKTGGKRAGYARPVLEIAAGTRPLSGAQITYDAKRKKWFAALTFEEAKRPAVALESGRVAMLRPGRSRWCWTLRINGRTERLGGRGHHVAHVRKSLLLQRWGRQHIYTYSPRRKGRSRNRALQPLFKLTNRWRNFTKSCNQLLVAGVVERLLQAGCGQLVLVNGSDRRLLATAGKLPGREDATGWPWYQVEQLLQWKCQRYGIQVRLRSGFSGQSQAVTDVVG